MSDLRAKLAALGHLSDRREDAAREHAPAADLATVLGAAEEAAPSGPVLVRTRRFPVGTPWGEARLAQPRFGARLAGYVGAALPSPAAASRVAFVDTETTGLAGGSGTYAFLVGIARFEDEAFVLRQFFLRGPWEERPLLEAAAELLHGADAVVSYNGKSFDVPLLAGRFALHGMPDPLRATPHVDLLHLARRVWRERLPDCSLGEVERGALGMRRGAEDVPGHLIPELYFSFLRSGDASALTGVLHHNELDICSLAALLARVDDLLEGRVAADALPWVDLVSLARTLAALGDDAQARQLYDFAAGRAADAPAATDALANDAWLRAGRLAKRHGDLAAAFEHFRRAADHPTPGGGEVAAAIEIAKLLEHQSQQVEDALAWVDHGLRGAAAVRDPLARRRLAADLAYRRDRLLRKIAAQEDPRAACQASSS